MKNLLTFVGLSLSLFLGSCSADPIGENDAAKLLNKDQLYLDCCTDMGQIPAGPFEEDEPV